MTEKKRKKESYAGPAVLAGLSGATIAAGEMDGKSKDVAAGRYERRIRQTKVARERSMHYDRRAAMYGDWAQKSSATHPYVTKEVREEAARRHNHYRQKAAAFRLKQVGGAFDGISAQMYRSAAHEARMVGRIGGGAGLALAGVSAGAVARNNKKVRDGDGDGKLREGVKKSRDGDGDGKLNEGNRAAAIGVGTAAGAAAGVGGARAAHEGSKVLGRRAAKEYIRPTSNLDPKKWAGQRRTLERYARVAFATEGKKNLAIAGAAGAVAGGAAATVATRDKVKKSSEISNPTETKVRKNMDVNELFSKAREGSFVPTEAVAKNLEAQTTADVIDAAREHFEKAFYDGAVRAVGAAGRKTKSLGASGLNQAKKAPSVVRQGAPGAVGWAKTNAVSAAKKPAVQVGAAAAGGAAVGGFAGSRPNKPKAV